MKSTIVELIDLSKRNSSVCPWCSKKKSDDYFKFLKSEIDELEAAFKNDDLDNIEEELGDVLWDTIALIHICEREKKFKGDKVISRVLEKFARRKPWLLSGKSVTSDEALMIWDEAKKMEKQNRQNSKC